MSAAGSPCLRPDWIYRIWEFNANHRQLLIRAGYAPDGEEQGRSELWFGNVSFVVPAPIIQGLAPSFFAGGPWPERPEDTSGSI